MELGLLFYVLAIISFGISAIVGERIKSVNLVALGLAFFVMGHIIV